MDVLVVQERGSECLTLPNYHFLSASNASRQLLFDNLAAPRVGNGVIDDVDTGGEADSRCCQPKSQVRNLENIIFWIF